MRAYLIIFLLASVIDLQASVDQGKSAVVVNDLTPEMLIQDLELKNRIENLVKYSLHNRKGKSLSATAGFGYDYFGTNISLSLEYFVSQNILAGFNFSNISQLSDTHENDPSYIKMYSINSKLFFSNSFFLAPAILYRKFHVERKIYNKYLYDGYQLNYIKGSLATLDRKDFAAELSIGNQWQWEHFTIGCKWIGLVNQMSLYHDKNPQQVYFQDFNKRFTIRILNLYMGASF